MWYICTMEYFSSMKKNEIMPFTATWMDLKNIILSEVNQREKADIIYYLYVESDKLIQMNLFTKQKQTPRHRKQTYGYQSRKEGRDKFGVWNYQIHTTMFKIDKQQGFSV